MAYLELDLNLRIFFLFFHQLIVYCNPSSKEKLGCQPFNFFNFSDEAIKLSTSEFLGLIRFLSLIIFFFVPVKCIILFSKLFMDIEFPLPAL